jgi:hypothetical protein
VGAQVGAAESSGLRGGLSGIETQKGANLGFNLQTQSLGRQIGAQQRRGAKAASLGAIGGGIAGIGGSLFEASGGLDFGGSSPNPILSAGGLFAGDPRLGIGGSGRLGGGR